MFKEMNCITLIVAVLLSVSFSHKAVAQANPLNDPNTVQWLENAAQTERDKTQDRHNIQETGSLEVLNSCTLKYIDDVRETDPTGRWIIGWSDNRTTSIINLASMTKPGISYYKNDVNISADNNFVSESNLMTFGTGSPVRDSDSQDVVGITFQDSTSVKAGEILSQAIKSCTAGPSQQSPGVVQNQQNADRIAQLQADIQQHENMAQNDEASAQNVLNSNCSGPGAGICQSIAMAGAAKFRSDENKEISAANADRAEIAHLQGSTPPAEQPLTTNSTSYNQTTNNFNTNTFGNANNGDAAVAACKNGNPYQNDNSLCQSNPNLQQASCYRAAADICRCYLNAYPGNSNSSQWQSCVVNNDAKADQLNSSSHSVGGGTTQTNSNGNSGNSGNINLNNCPPGAIGCAGVAK